MGRCVLQVRKYGIMKRNDSEYLSTRCDNTITNVVFTQVCIMLYCSPLLIIPPEPNGGVGNNGLAYGPVAAAR